MGIEVDLKCSECGDYLESTDPVKGVAVVTPCVKCQDKAFDDGRKQGEQEARNG